MKFVILAAGKGTRLGMSHPKPLTKLKTGETILQRQIDSLSKYVDKKNIIVVVGYKKELIMNEFPDCTFIFNPNYEKTNTAKSLLCALNSQPESDIIWINGDVVFDPKVLIPILNSKESCMLVNTEKVSEEEVKYNLNNNGTIKQVSKDIKDGIGEAVGINKITKNYIKNYIEALKKCNDQDYFEYGIELLIQKNIPIYPIDISSTLCMEIDFKEDLELINKKL
tara:strand:+ start:1776 stop:2447 length:672 start_codon:yes stop_codon:yes gene_type:complete